MKAKPRRMLGSTLSVCPVCLKRIEAKRVGEGDEVYLEKSCPEHGVFRVQIWGGHVPYTQWNRLKTPSGPVNPETGVHSGCPYDCGLCPGHRQHSCCVLLEVTRRCDLKCPVCFASAGGVEPDPDMDTLVDTLRDMLTRGGPFNIQLSGGEPTMRDDLPELIRAGKDMGCTFFQLNTNGLRIASETGYAQTLAGAGLDCVFLQFDGVSDEVYIKTRGRPLMERKRAAIEACREAGLGVVLVPTVCRDINTHEIGAVIDFAAKNMPCVRGVHFQPMAYFGRYPGGAPAERFTLSHLLYEIERQTGGRIKMGGFAPGGAENAYCSFSGNFIINEDGSVKPWNNGDSCGCGSSTPVAAERASQSRKFVARAWKGVKVQVRAREEATASLDDFLDAINYRSLAISAMAFMDAWTLDLDRLRDCYIHVAEGRRLIPFCAYNLTATDGRSLYRT